MAADVLRLRFVAVLVWAFTELESIHPALVFFRIELPPCCVSGPPQLIAGSEVLIIPVAAATGTIWLVHWALRRGRVRTAEVVAGISLLASLVLAFLTFMLFINTLGL